MPVINENDVVDLNSFGGNDFLAANMAKLLKVDQLLILSTMAGSNFGVGGGKAKLQAVAMLKEKIFRQALSTAKQKIFFWRHYYETSPRFGKKIKQSAGKLSSVSERRRNTFAPSFRDYFTKTTRDY